jgi:hypothetical protein
LALLLLPLLLAAQGGCSALKHRNQYLVYVRVMCGGFVRGMRRARLQSQGVSQLLPLCCAVA